MIIKSVITSIMLLVISFSSYAQQPQWLHKLPKAENSTYVYRMESSTAYAEEDARNKAFLRMLQSVANSLGVAYNSQTANDAVLNGGDFQTISSTLNIPINKVCEYTERTNNGYRVYVLCQVAKAGNITPNFTAFRDCASVKSFSNGGALIKSMLIPGWGQMSKGRVGEGIFTLVGELALGGYAYLNYNWAQEKLKTLNTTTDGYYYANSRDEYNEYKTMNNIALGAAVGLYAFNLYRAVAAKPKHKGVYSFTPTIMPHNNNLAMGVSLTIKL